MKSKYVLVLVSLILVNVVFSQTINQPDDIGKKNGKWIVYLDKNWRKTSDSGKAVCCRYTWFDHGVNIYPMGTPGGKGYKLEPGTSSPNGLLNGEYKWYDAKGRLSSVHVFKNGEYISCKEYYSTGELQQYFDYTKKCEGQEHGWTVYIYEKNGNLKSQSSVCKDKNGNWPNLRG